MSKSDDFILAWTQGWMAATQAIMRALQETARGELESTALGKADFLSAAGDKPSIARQGAAEAAPGTTPVKRPRGRPRKIRPETTSSGAD